MKVTYEYACERCNAGWKQTYTVPPRCPAPLPDQPTFDLYLCAACIEPVREAIRDALSTTGSRKSEKARLFTVRPPTASGEWVT